MPPSKNPTSIDFSEIIDTKRIDWWPGKDQKSAKVTIREAGNSDVLAVSKILKVKPRAAQRWISFTPFTCRLAVRNMRYPVGVVVADHGPEENKILRFWFKHDGFAAPAPFAVKLLLATALEQPEVGTVIDVPMNDEATQRIVEKLGWRLDGVDDDVNTYRSNPWEPIK